MKRMIAGLLGMFFCLGARAEMVDFDAKSIEVIGELNGFEVNLESRELEPGLEIITVHLSREDAARPPKFTLKWLFPSVEVHKFWNPNYKVDRVDYGINTVRSSSTQLAPVVAFMDIDDNNRFCFALDDALNKLTLRTELVEEDACFHCKVTLFEEPFPAVTDYSIELRVDRRDENFAKTLGDVSDWWAGKDAYKPAPVPEVALRPIYSTWYSYHQSLDVDQIVAECAEAKKIGMEAVIVDDGWQTLDSARGYAFTGDWKPERIPDMKGFVQRIHDLDMKFMLWYSVPFVGEKAANYERFKGKYLGEWANQGTWVLDPRYPEVREFIIKTYETAMDEWKLDGFKLDFLGLFKTRGNTVLTAEDGRDFASVNDAVDVLMSKIMERLRARNPEVMIEFRQPYNGPLMRKYGNMLRAVDCPNMAVINKVRVTDVRLLGGNTAIHADMLMWNGGDTVENAALQILNVIFSVPQISVRLDEIPAEHKQMIRFWVDYWNANRDVLISGDFRPQAPDALYPVISSSKGGKTITAVYNDCFITFDSAAKETDVINARKSTDVVLLNNGKSKKFHYEIFDCLGASVEKGTVKLREGANAFTVPASGMLRLKTDK